MAWTSSMQWRPLNPEEIAEFSPTELALYREAEARNVFGVGYRKDALGNPIEQGLGSASNESAQSRAALKLEADRKAVLKLAAGMPNGV